MAEENTPESEDEQPKGGSKKLVIILAAVILLLGGGGGAAFFLLSAEPTEEMDAENPCNPGAGGTEDAGSNSLNFQERLFPLEPFVVNVTGHEYARYLKVKVELEVDKIPLKDEIGERLPQVRDAVILLLSSKRLADITDFEGKALLKEDIRDRVNGVLETGSVRSVMFTEFVVQ